MGIERVKEGKSLYHLTKLDNLDSILENGLISRKRVNDNNIDFSDVANPDIIEKRLCLGLEEYVPFHFHPYSSFDVKVKNTYFDEEFVYICITRELARYNRFKILPIHPLAKDQAYSLYEYDEGFSKIDWKVMQTKGLDDDYSKHVKMAECLTELIVPFKCFHCICVRNEEIKRIVEEKIEKHGLRYKPPYVDIQNWF